MLNGVENGPPMGSHQRNLKTSLNVSYKSEDTLNFRGTDAKYPSIHPSRFSIAKQSRGSSSLPQSHSHSQKH
ncbi:hypothetical protein ABKV19_020367 [Rosa sericea]